MIQKIILETSKTRSFEDNWTCLLEGEFWSMFIKQGRAERSVMPSDYYLKRKDKLLDKHRKLMAIGQPLLAERFEETFVAARIEEAVREFEALLPVIPYIGGKKNPLTDTLVEMTSMLALYRALREHMPLEEIGELTYQMALSWIEQYPQLFRHLIGRYYMSGFMQRRKRRQAKLSQEEIYPGDFVFEYVEGDGENFDWGINYLSCAIVKFFDDQGASELTPYMCRIDFLMFPALGITLKRSGTKAQGCSHCDFRFKWGGSAAKTGSSGLK